MSIRIIPTNSIRTILAYWLKCTCCCQSRVIITGVISVIGDRDQAQPVAVALAEDGLEQRSSLCRQGSLPRLRHVAQIHGPQPFLTIIEDRDRRRGTLLPYLILEGHKVDARTRCTPLALLIVLAHLNQ